MSSDSENDASATITFLRFAAPIASQFVFLAPLSTMRKIAAEKSCGKISPLPFSSMVIAGAVWSTYGFLKQEASIWVPNLSAIIFGSFYISIFTRYLDISEKNSMNKHWLGGAMILSLLALVIAVLPRESALQCIGVIGTVIVVVMFSGPLATIQTVIRERSTNSLTPLFTLASFCNCLLWLCLGLGISDAFVWAPNVLGLVAVVIQIGLFGVYGLPTKTPRSDEQLGMLDRRVTA